MQHATPMLVDIMERKLITYTLMISLNDFILAATSKIDHVIELVFANPPYFGGRITIFNPDFNLS